MVYKKNLIEALYLQHLSRVFVVIDAVVAVVVVVIFVVQF